MCKHEQQKPSGALHQTESDVSSLHMQAGKGDPKAQFKQDRIPGSSFFDMDNIADKSSSLPHMLPTEAAFAAAAGALGITNETQVVVYDRLGIFSAARVWWTFQVFSHNRSVSAYLKHSLDEQHHSIDDANCCHFIL